MSDTATLLGELRDLRKRPRADARRYAPPLLLFGVLILASVALYRPIDVPTQYQVTTSMDVLVGNGTVYTAHPGLIVAYWLAMLVGGTAFTAWWYHVRAVRSGIELRTQPQLMAAGAALLGIFVGTPALSAILGPDYWPEAEPFVHIPLLVISAVVALAVLGWSASRARRDGARTAGLVAGFVLATVAAGALTMYLFWYLALLVVGAVVFAIAWVERSWWLAFIGAAFVTTSLFVQIPAPDLLEYLGLMSDNAQIGVLHDLLLPSAVLLVGGLGGLAAQAVRRRTP